MRRILVLLAGLALGIAVWIWLDRGARPVPAAEAQSDRDARTAESDAAARLVESEELSHRVAAEQAKEDQLPSPTEPQSTLADPTEEELARFAQSVPAGTIEGIVLRGLTPVDGGLAWLGASATGGLPWGSSATWDADLGVARAPIGTDGTFRFAGLGPDTYGIGVRAPDGATRHVYFQLPADAPTQRIRIVLGTGGVRGHVYDEQGSACAGWQIAIFNYGRMLAGVQVIDGRETDAAGAFEFSGLTSGRYMLSAGPIADRRDPRTRTVSFDLGAGEWRTVDLGSSSAALWTGRVLLPRGTPLQLAAHTELRIEAGDVRETAVLSPEGGFQFDLAAGTYHLSLLAHSPVAGTLVDLGEIAVPASGWERDVVLPRALLRVRGTYQGTQQQPGTTVSTLQTWIEGSGLRLSGLRGADGNQYFLALAPGEYQLSAHPAILGAQGNKVPVSIREADDEVELDLVVGDP